MKTKNKSIGIWPKRETVAINGYLVKHNPFERLMWIEKEGFHICYVQSLAEAIKTIETLAYTDRIGETETVIVDSKAFTGTVYHVRENGWACVETSGGECASGPQVEVAK